MNCNLLGQLRLRVNLLRIIESTIPNRRTVNSEPESDLVGDHILNLDFKSWLQICFLIARKESRRTITCNVLARLMTIEEEQLKRNHQCKGVYRSRPPMKSKWDLRYSSELQSMTTATVSNEMQWPILVGLPCRWQKWLDDANSEGTLKLR